MGRDVGQDAGRLGERVHPRVGRGVVGRHDADRDPCEVRSLRLAREQGEGGVARQFSEFLARRGGEGRHPRAGLQKRFGSTRRGDAAANDGGALASHVEKYRQMNHRILIDFAGSAALWANGLSRLARIGQRQSGRGSGLATRAEPSRRRIGSAANPGYEPGRYLTY